MERTRQKKESLETQIKRRVATRTKESTSEYEGNDEIMISTGSTLLDLAISGGRKRGGGLPGGILVEIFGPSSSGKTVLLCEIAGNIQRQGGEVKFRDPEARLNKQFAKMFGLQIQDKDYSRPDTVPEIFNDIVDWNPSPKTVIHGIFNDSLAALSTDQEMEKEEGDKMGMRRAKEFSEQLRKTCRVLADKNLLMVCSNQVRENLDAGPYGQKYKSPGGEAIGFYSSVRLRTFKPEKLKLKTKFAGKEIQRVVGIETQIEVFKNSVWKPNRMATIIVDFDYGIDDIQANLQFIKDFTKNTQYTVRGKTLSNSMQEAIRMVENDRLERQLREEVIDLWEEIENDISKKRERKKRHAL